MIEVAIVLSDLMHQQTGFIIILALLRINSIVGFWEEY
jgi:hypothetical protein